MKLGPDTPTRLELLARVVALGDDNARLVVERDRLRDRVERLEARIEELERKTSQNSRNSSKPPSSDPPDVKVGPPKQPSGRKPGGQPGHKGHRRELLPPDRVNKVEDHWPDECAECQAKLRDRGLITEVEPERHQVAEIPALTAEVTEHRLHGVVCPKCEHVTHAELPQGVPPGAFGPRLVALVALLAGAYRMSKRNVAGALGDVIGVKMSVGSVSACESTISGNLKEPVDEAREYMQRQPVVNADETSWTERRLKAWLWVAATAFVAVFHIDRSRGAAAARKLLGSFKGILTTDRWSSYSGWALARRQICWAHLKRDFTFISERGGRAGEIGTALVAATREMFVLWHQARDGTLSRGAFAKAVMPIRLRIERLIKDGAGCGHARVSGMCWELLKMESAMWTFVRVRGVEPTNNHAERTLRPAVIWRKTSFGTHSEAGSRYAERMMTTVATLKLQKRGVFEYLVGSQPISPPRSARPVAPAGGGLSR